VGENAAEAEAEARQFLEDAGDAEGATSIELAKFLAVAARMANERLSAKGLTEWLDAVDDDGSGVIPGEQLPKVMLNHGDSKGSGVIPGE
jgi:calmodulin